MKPLTKPLSGKIIINTRMKDQALVLTQTLSALGARVIEMPTIAIKFVGQQSELFQKIHYLHQYDWILFTSANSVKAFFTLLSESGQDCSALARINIACIGKGTQATVNQYYNRVAVTAQPAVAEGLLHSLESYKPWQGKRVLLPVAAKARTLIPDTLKKWGVKLDKVKAYTTILPAKTNKEPLEMILHNEYDLLTFTSSSTFLNFIHLIGVQHFQVISKKIKAASIGPITSSTMITKGVKPMCEAKESTMDGLVTCIIKYFNK